MWDLLNITLAVDHRSPWNMQYRNKTRRMSVRANNLQVHTQTRKYCECHGASNIVWSVSIGHHDRCGV